MHCKSIYICRIPNFWYHHLRFKCDGKRSETRFRPSTKRTTPFKSPGARGGGGAASVQSTTGSRGVRISGSNARYNIFRGSVRSTGSPTPFASFPFTSPLVPQRAPSHFNWTLQHSTACHNICCKYCK
jgi:hypothetical protein